MRILIFIYHMMSSYFTGLVVKFSAAVTFQSEGFNKIAIIITTILCHISKIRFSNRIKGFLWKDWRQQTRSDSWLRITLFDLEK